MRIDKRHPSDEDYRPEEENYDGYSEDDDLDNFSVDYEDDFGEPHEGEVYYESREEYYGDYGGYSSDGYDEEYVDDDEYDGYDDSNDYSEQYDYSDEYEDSYENNDGTYDSQNDYDEYNDYQEEYDVMDSAPSKKGRKQNRTASTKKKKKKKGRIRKFILKLIILLIVLLIGFFGFLLIRLNPTDFPTDDSSLSVDTSVSQSGVTNIALFGVDARDYSENTRSDAIMILSINQKNGTIKLSTLMRDTLVSVPGYGQMKLTESYAYGGPELTVKTINENFDMDIKEYATVTFKAMAQIIDAAGGVVVDITEEERVSANGSVWEQWDSCGMDADYIAEAGKQTLSGTQAVAYARIRHVGNADYQRTARQRTVLTALIKQLLTHPYRIPQTLMTAEDVVDTSLSQSDILSLMPIVLRGINIDSARFPLNADIISDSYYVGNSACIYADMNSTISSLHAFIYDDINPTTDADRRSNGEE